MSLASALGPAVVLVGLGGGLVGAAYVGLLHLLTRWMGPAQHSSPVVIAILVATGAAVVVLTRIGGDSGNVELLVDNIHVLGGADDVRRTRSLVPVSLLCIAPAGPWDPRRRWCRRPAPWAPGWRPGRAGTWSTGGS